MASKETSGRSSDGATTSLRSASSIGRQRVSPISTTSVVEPRHQQAWSVSLGYSKDTSRTTFSSSSTTRQPSNYTVTLQLDSAFLPHSASPEKPLDVSDLWISTTNISTTPEQTS